MIEIVSTQLTYTIEHAAVVNIGRCSLSLFVTRDMTIGSRWLRPGEDCQEGAEAWIEIGIGLHKPTIGIAYGGYRHNVWKEKGKRYDLGYMFDFMGWMNPYGVCGSRWDRWIQNKVKWWLRSRKQPPF